MDTLHSRLKISRIAAGYKTAKSAAEDMGLATAAYSHHENGTKVMSVDAVADYAAAFNTTVEWLMLGKLDGLRPGSTTSLAEVDPLLLATWQGLGVKQRKKLLQIALILVEE